MRVIGVQYQDIYLGPKNHDKVRCPKLMHNQIGCSRYESLVMYTRVQIVATYDTLIWVHIVVVVYFVLPSRKIQFAILAFYTCTFSVPVFLGPRFPFLNNCRDPSASIQLHVTCVASAIQILMNMNYKKLPNLK